MAGAQQVDGCVFEAVVPPDTRDRGRGHWIVEPIGHRFSLTDAAQIIPRGGIAARPPADEDEPRLG